MRYGAVIGLRVNYGMQAFYRAHGIEPRCGICQHFEGELLHPLGEARLCTKNARACEPGDICHAPERAPGADDEG